MDLRRANTPEPLNMTWAGERGEQHRPFQSPGLFFLLTLPFIERAYRTCGFVCPVTPGFEGKNGAPGGTRTPDLLVRSSPGHFLIASDNSRLLCFISDLPRID